MKQGLFHCQKHTKPPEPITEMGKLSRVHSKEPQDPTKGTKCKHNQLN